MQSTIYHCLSEYVHTGYVSRCAYELFKKIVDLKKISKISMYGSVSGLRCICFVCDWHFIKFSFLASFVCFWVRWDGNINTVRMLHDMLGKQTWWISNMVCQSVNQIHRCTLHICISIFKYAYEFDLEWVIVSYLFVSIHRTNTKYQMQL